MLDPFAAKRRLVKFYFKERHGGRLIANLDQAAMPRPTENAYEEVGLAHAPDEVIGRREVVLVLDVSRCRAFVDIDGLACAHIIVSARRVN